MLISNNLKTVNSINLKSHDCQTLNIRIFRVRKSGTIKKGPHQGDPFFIFSPTTRRIKYV